MRQRLGLCSRRSMLSTIRQRKHRWLGHVLRNEVSLREITERRMKGKAYHDRKRPHMLSDLVQSTQYLIGQQKAAEDCEGWSGINMVE